eukprot:6473294-Amphidinium_carterae.2
MDGLDPMPIVHVDYMFVKADVSEQVVCFVSMCDSAFKRCHVARVQKGNDKFAVHSLVTFVRQLGHVRLIIQCDSEHSVKKLVDVVCKTCPHVVPRTTPVASKQSLGMGERLHQTIQGLARTLRAHVKAKYEFVLSINHPMAEWCFRHACWLRNHYHRDARDKKTPFERQFGHDFPHMV